MGNEIAPRTGHGSGTGLATRHGLNRQQIDLVKQTIAKGATDLELEWFLEQCNARGLSPFNGQVWGVKRREQVDGQWREVFATQVGIAGLRLIAERTGRYGGRLSQEWCGRDGVWRDVWLEEDPPAAARVAIRRTDVPTPIVGTVLYREYVQTNRDGRPIGRWRSAPSDMLAKCAESAALRAAFPEELAGLQFTTDDGPGEPPPEARPTGEPPRSVAAERWSQLLAYGAQFDRDEGDVREAIDAAGLPRPSSGSLADTPQGAATFDAMLGALGQAFAPDDQVDEIEHEDDGDQGEPVDDDQAARDEEAVEAAVAARWRDPDDETAPAAGDDHPPIPGQETLA